MPIFFYTVQFDVSYGRQLLSTIDSDAVSEKLCLQQHKRPNYCPLVKKWQLTCWYQEVCKEFCYQMKIYTLNRIFTKISGCNNQKRWFLQKFPRWIFVFLYGQGVSIKSTVLPENDLAIFKVRQAQSICSFISVFFEDQLIYLWSFELQ